MTTSKQLIITVFLLVFSFLGSAQTVIENPKFRLSESSEVEIIKLELSEEYTIFHFKFETPSTYHFGGWASVLKTIYIQDITTKKRYFLEKAVNIPYYPKKHKFKGPGEELNFSLYFEPVDTSTTVVNLIENMEGGFTFIEIQLTEEE